MPTSKAATVKFTVTRSFATFNEGEEIESPRDDWAKAHEKAGLLKEVSGAGEGQDQARQG